jgi:hypothetical protein
MEATVTGEEYQEAIDALKMSQVGSARFFNVAESTPRRWISEVHPIPTPVSMVLKTMVHLGLTPREVLAICGIREDIMEKEVARETADL